MGLHPSVQSKWESSFSYKSKPSYNSFNFGLFVRGPFLYSEVKQFVDEVKQMHTERYKKYRRELHEGKKYAPKGETLKSLLQKGKTSGVSLKKPPK